MLSNALYFLILSVSYICKVHSACFLSGYSNRRGLSTALRLFLFLECPSSANVQDEFCASAVSEVSCSQRYGCSLFPAPPCLTMLLLAQERSSSGGF